MAGTFITLYIQNEKAILWYFTQKWSKRQEQKKSLKLPLPNVTLVITRICLGMICIAEKNLAKGLTITESLSQVDQVSAQRWQSLIGTIQAEAAHIPLGRL